jgi:hypothetical protein
VECEQRSFPDATTLNREAVLRIQYFQREVTKFTIKNKEEFAMADESLLSDYSMMYALQTLLVRSLADVEAWNVGGGDDTGLASIAILAYRYTNIFLKDRRAIVDDFFGSLAVPGTKSVPRLFEEQDPSYYVWLNANGNLDNTKVRPQERRQRAFQLIKLLEGLMDIAREEMVSFLDRMYLGRVLSFSKPGHAVDILLGAK